MLSARVQNGKPRFGKILLGVGKRPQVSVKHISSTTSDQNCNVFGGKLFHNSTPVPAKVSLQRFHKQIIWRVIRCDFFSHHHHNHSADENNEL